MSEAILPEARACAVCGADASLGEPFLPDTVDARRLSAHSFASRKIPEFMSHAMLRCTRCDLVFVPRPPSQEALAVSYHQADYDSSKEAEDAADAYLQAIRPVLDHLDGRSGAALEIGTGTGAFLERLSAAGFSEVVGIEPSPAAIAGAPERRKPWIREGIFREDDFEPESFDLICCFMTLEHVRDPGDLVASAYRLLRPGGAFVSVTHDYRSFVNRVLGRRSPIIDVEHMQLFSAASAQALLARRGYRDVGGMSFRNRYRPSYWVRLTPLPAALKKGISAVLGASGLDRHRLAFNVGNWMTWGFKPVESVAAATSTKASSTC